MKTYKQFINEAKAPFRVMGFEEELRTKPKYFKDLKSAKQYAKKLQKKWDTVEIYDDKDKTYRSWGPNSLPIQEAKVNEDLWLAHRPRDSEIRVIESVLKKLDKGGTYLNDGYPTQFVLSNGKTKLGFSYAVTVYKHHDKMLDYKGEEVSKESVWAAFGSYMNHEDNVKSRRPGQNSVQFWPTGDQTYSSKDFNDHDAKASMKALKQVLKEVSKQVKSVI